MAIIENGNVIAGVVGPFELRWAGVPNASVFPNVGTGCKCTDTVAGKAYINISTTPGTPNWVVIGTQA